MHGPDFALQAPMTHKFLAATLLCGLSLSAHAETKTIKEGNLKLFVDKNDGQPRCPGCISVTLEVNTKLPMGAAVVSDIQSRIISTNMTDKIAGFVSFKEVSRTQSKAIYKGTVAVPSLLARETQGLSLVVEGFGRACMNMARLDCSFLEVKDNLVAPMNEVLSLGN